MKKNLTSILALICALLSLAVSLASLATLKSANEALFGTIANLEAQITQLRSDLESKPTCPDTPDENVAEAYCTLTVETWSATEQTLTADLFVLAYLPSAEISQAQLYFICGDQTQVRDIEMQPGEGENSFEANLPGLVFDLPEPESGDELILELITTCTGGRTIHARVNWYFEDGMLELVSG